MDPAAFRRRERNLRHPGQSSKELLNGSTLPHPGGELDVRFHTSSYEGDLGCEGPKRVERMTF